MSFIFSLPCVGRWQRERRRQQAYSEIEQLEPFPYAPRKRALTLPGIEYSAQQQLSCPLFESLPVEIRLIIYKNLLGGKSLHIGNLERRLQHWVCRLDCRTEVQEGLTLGLRLPLWITAKDRDLLPILLTCRQAYSEAINLLYSSNTLVLIHPGTLLLLPKLILPQRLHAIRSLRLHWWLCEPPPLTPGNQSRSDWIDVCAILAKMEGLRDLCVELAMTRVWRFQQFMFGAKILDPLKVVTRPKDFELRVPFLESFATADLDGIPFQVRFYSNLELDEMCQFRYPQRCIYL